MKYITKEVRIGIAGIAALCILVYGINYLKGINMFKPSSYFYVKFQNVNGLTKSSPVFADGFRVGIVRDLYYDYSQPGKVIAETMAGVSPETMPAVLVRSHGPFTWGKDAAAAVHHAVVLEKLAMMAYYTEAVSPSTPAPIQPALLDKHFLRKHGKNAYYGQNGNH